MPSLPDLPYPKSYTLARNHVGLLLWSEVTRAIRVGARPLPSSLAAEQDLDANSGLLCPILSPSDQVLVLPVDEPGVRRI